MKKENPLAKKIAAFDANNPAAADNNIFGLPFTTDEAKLVLLPIPWEVTVSYQSGTAKGPAAIFEASKQVDLYDPILPNAWHSGIAMLPINSSVQRMSKRLRPKVEKYIDAFTNGKEITIIKNQINEASLWLNDWVKKSTLEQLKKGKLVGLIGGDHSTPLGYITALAEEHDFGILQIDAHCDLRKAYEGFTHSHASIMYNAVRLKSVTKLVQVGIRDYCDEELKEISSNKKIKTFFDKGIKSDLYNGSNWAAICKSIVKQLPEKVYISFDIDGLDPKLCPHTGTPVPGGLEFEQAVFLLEELILSGKKIIGFDLNEVAPGKDEWDANVGARLLFKLCHLILKSNAN